MGLQSDTAQVDFGKLERIDSTVCLFNLYWKPNPFSSRSAALFPSNPFIQVQTCGNTVYYGQKQREHVQLWQAIAACSFVDDI